VTIFRNDYFGFAGILGVRVINLVSVNKHDQVGILLDSAGLPKITRLWAMVGSGICTPV
jgi:hypothetical protein